MARTARHDVDYFPFYVKDGKTLFILESKYGLQGIGFFTNLMRFLCKQPDHFICIETESDSLYFFAQIRCQQELGMDMLNLMAKTGKIDAELWDSRRVIVSQDLLDSLRDAYQKRINPIIEIDQIRSFYPGKEITAPDITENDPDMTQRKLKERKLKERKECDLPEWIKKETWNAFMEVRKKLKAPQTDTAIKLIISKLAKLKSSGQDPNEIINESIQNGWRGVFPLKAMGGNNRKTFTPPSSERDVREYQPEEIPAVSEEERKRNIEIIKRFTNSIGRASP